MNMFEVFFMLAFILMMIAVLVKVYNIFTMCKWLKGRDSFIIFIMSIMLWFVAMVSFLYGVENNQILSYLLQFNNNIFRSIMFLSVIELFIHIWYFAQDKMVQNGLIHKRYDPNKE